MMLKTCALIALIAFAQIVRAQDDMEDFKEKQDDDEGLESRYGGGRHNNYQRGKGASSYRNARKGAYKNNLRVSGSQLAGGLGRGNGGNLEGIELDVANQIETNKVVPGIVEVAPTVVTNSNSAQVLASTRRQNYRQNSASRVVQNNVVKSTDIHIHTNRKIKMPKTINTVVRRHKTEYIINTQPIKTNINIERQQEIIKPEVQNVVVYQNTESLQRHRRPTIVRNKEERQRLPTVVERPQNLGTEVIGNPVNAGSASLALVGGGSRGNGGLNLGGGGGYRRGNYKLGGARRYNKGGSKYGGLHERANEKAQDDEEEMAAPEVAKTQEDEEVKEVTN